MDPAARRAEIAKMLAKRPVVARRIRFNDVAAKSVTVFNAKQQYAEFKQLATTFGIVDDPDFHWDDKRRVFTCGRTAQEPRE